MEAFAPALHATWKVSHTLFSNEIEHLPASSTAAAPPVHFDTSTRFPPPKPTVPTTCQGIRDARHLSIAAEASSAHTKPQRQSEERTGFLVTKTSFSRPESWRSAFCFKKQETDPYPFYLAPPLSVDPFDRLPSYLNLPCELRILRSPVIPDSGLKYTSVFQDKSISFVYVGVNSGVRKR
ncbi:hypothetical protein NMY22_g15671 [Coprinellus aureogranulatus]|nr:hypothetical protein NMY22_g15671 [Coprinellus aureogranulatus]